MCYGSARYLRPVRGAKFSGKEKLLRIGRSFGLSFFMGISAWGKRVSGGGRLKCTFSQNLLVNTDLLHDPENRLRLSISVLKWVPA